MRTWWATHADSDTVRSALKTIMYMPLKIKLLDGLKLVVNVMRSSKCEHCGRTVWLGADSQRRFVPVVKTEAGSYIKHSWFCQSKVTIIK